jgi:mannose-6-phosphate isomerase-like protein (cupin superfamily)
MEIIRFEDKIMIPASHEDFKSPGVLKKVLLQREKFIDGRVQMINWAFLAAGKSFRAHYHEDMQEVFILVKGQAQIIVDKESSVLYAGDSVVIPVGSVHSMSNTGENDVEYIVIGIAKGIRGKTITV